MAKNPRTKKEPQVIEFEAQAGVTEAEARHAFSLVGASAAKRKCPVQNVVITCKPQLVSCTPVIVLDDCKKVSINLP